MSTTEKRRYTVEEYLEFERASDTKHEYYQGEIFAMTGASLRHNRIVSNLSRLLGNDVEDRGCEVLANDMRIKIDATGLYTYPEVTVVCSEPQLEENVFDTLLNPKLIIEVLSESTEACDRGQKFAHYRTVPSLEEYVLVSQEEYRVEVFARQDGGAWVLSEAIGRESAIHFRSIECRLNLEDIYRRVEIPPRTQEQTND